MALIKGAKMSKNLTTSGWNTEQNLHHHSANLGGLFMHVIFNAGWIFL